MKHNVLGIYIQAETKLWGPNPHHKDFILSTKMPSLQEILNKDDWLWGGEKISANSERPSTYTASGITEKFLHCFLKYSMHDLSCETIHR